jgi:hypothetical protein
MIFGWKNKVQRINYKNNMEKLEDLTAKLPILELEDEKFKKTKNEIQMINKIIDIFRTVPDDKMYGEVLEFVLILMGSAYGVFGYIDSKGTFACPSMTRDVWDRCQMKEKDIVFPRESWGKSIWGRAIIEKKILYSNQPFKVPEGHISILKALMVPIIYHKKVIGLFEVANKKTDYTKDDRDMLEQTARLISPVLMAR